MSWAMTKISELRPGQYVDLHDKLDLDGDDDNESHMWDDIFALVISVSYDQATQALTLLVRGYDETDPYYREEPYEYTFFEDIQVEANQPFVMEMI
jgi:hypothetical protein